MTYEHRIGMLGGTFDPIHNGHISIARQAANEFGLSQVILVPAHQAPLRDKMAAPAANRVSMCQLVAETDPLFQVNITEINRQSPSYTIDTAEELVENNPRSSIWMIVGQDIVAELKRWKSIKRLLEIVRVIAVNRPGSDAPNPADIAHSLNARPDRLVSCWGNKSAISSTQIRNLARAGKDYSSLVHPSVASYIDKYNLYACKNNWMA